MPQLSPACPKLVQLGAGWAGASIKALIKSQKHVKITNLDQIWTLWTAQSCPNYPQPSPTWGSLGMAGVAWGSHKTP